MLAEACGANDCGYVQPSSVAYRECSEVTDRHARELNEFTDGIAGADKVFLFEFSMPTDSGASGNLADMPAIWMLNAQIPRTTQYGPADCNCWESGCGE